MTACSMVLACLPACLSLSSQHMPDFNGGSCPYPEARPRARHNRTARSTQQCRSTGTVARHEAAPGERTARQHLPHSCCTAAVVWNC